MKKLILILLSITSIHVFGQNIDYNKIILPDYVKDADFGEKLVQIAWRNNPENSILNEKKRIAKFDTWRYSADWLNFINGQVNINEYTLDRAFNNNNANTTRGFFPLWNVRLSANLGNLLTIPFDVKKSKIMQVIAESNINSQKLEMRMVVLKAYNNFLLTEKTYKIKTQMLSDTESSHKLVEQKFKNGETTFESYIASLNNSNSLSIGILDAENAYKNSKLELERLIGVKLEDVR